jgi:hypothetical protein
LVVFTSPKYHDITLNLTTNDSFQFLSIALFIYTPSFCPAVTDSVVTEVGTRKTRREAKQGDAQQGFKLVSDCRKLVQCNLGHLFFSLLVLPCRCCTERNSKPESKERHNIQIGLSCSSLLQNNYCLRAMLRG